MLSRTRRFALFAVTCMIAALAPAAAAMAQKGIRATVTNATDHKIVFMATSGSGRSQVSYPWWVLGPGETVSRDSGSQPSLDVKVAQCGNRPEVELRNPFIGAPTARLVPPWSSDREEFDEGESRIFSYADFRVRVSRRDDTYQKQFDIDVLRCDTDED
jgi:hypothetical protein